MSRATYAYALMNVPFEGNNGHDADVTLGLLVTQSGHFGRRQSGGIAAVSVSETSRPGRGTPSHLDPTVTVLIVFEYYSGTSEAHQLRTS